LSELEALRTACLCPVRHAFVNHRVCFASGHLNRRALFASARCKYSRGFQSRIAVVEIISLTDKNQKDTLLFISLPIRYAVKMAKPRRIKPFRATARCQPYRACARRGRIFPFFLSLPAELRELVYSMLLYVPGGIDVTGYRTGIL
jgi:hypothetical protein